MNPFRPFEGAIPAPSAGRPRGVVPSDLRAIDKEAADRASNPRRLESPLEHACSAQDGARDRLHETILSIENRLAAVRRDPQVYPSVVGTDPAIPPCAGTSPAVRHVESVTMFIDECSRRLAVVLDSLEI